MIGAIVAPAMGSGTRRALPAHRCRLRLRRLEPLAAVTAG
jgi:hypothetical protein